MTGDVQLDVTLYWDTSLDILLLQRIMLNNMYRMLKKGGRIFVDFRTERDSIYINQKKNRKKDLW